MTTVVVAVFGAAVGPWCEIVSRGPSIFDTATGSSDLFSVGRRSIADQGYTEASQFENACERCTIVNGRARPMPDSERRIDVTRYVMVEQVPS